MINKTAFVALSLIMVVSWVFGAVCDRMITRWFNSLYKPQKTPERRSCDTCKYEHTNPNESPCKECADDDIDMWQPGYITRCETCKWEGTPWNDEPCYGCSCGDRWEANR
jgi:hypothetical protein